MSVVYPAVTGWLVAHAAALTVGGHDDVAVRGLVLAVGAFTHAQLAAEKDAA